MGGETYITDRGGIDNTPFFYSCNKGGRWWTAEVDVYPDPTDPRLLERANSIVACATVNLFAEDVGTAPTGVGISLEPFTSCFPEIGPDAFLFFRKMRTIFDPKGLCAPGRQVFTEEEFKNFPDQALAGLNKMRQLHGMEPVVKK